MGAARVFLAVAVCLAASAVASAQVIEFESGGLTYQALTKNGLTIMVARLPSHIREFAVIQVAVSNGSQVSWTVKPEDFTFRSSDGREFQAKPAKDVVNSLMEKAGRKDVIRLVTTYETGLSGLPKFQSTHGYQQRRDSALAEVSSAKLKAAAAASAIAFVPSKLQPGQSTDGAVFWATAGKPLGAGRLTVHAAGETFEFVSEASATN